MKTPHSWPIRVYYEDTDAGGVVYHAAYLKFAERARTEALRALDAPHAQMQAQHGAMFVVRRLEIDYLRPALLDDQLVVETVVTRLRGASAVLRQTVLRKPGPRGADALAVLGVSLAAVSCDGLKPARIPARWREGLASLLDQSDGFEIDVGD